MFVVWFIIGCVMVLLYWYFEWKLWRIAIKRFYAREEVILPGKRWYHIIAVFLITFIALSSFYFAITSFTYAKVILGCWLLPSLLIASLNALSTTQRLRLLKFGSESG